MLDPLRTATKSIVGHQAISNLCDAIISTDLTIDRERNEFIVVPNL
jgi:hypothetical protein